MQELIDSAKTQLIGNRQALESLEHNSGSAVTGSAEVFDDFTSAVAEWDKSLTLSQSHGMHEACSSHCQPTQFCPVDLLTQSCIAT